jgi:hypothetical protein
VIFLDANILLRYLVEPDTPENHARGEAAAALFDAVE